MTTSRLIVLDPSFSGAIGHHRRVNANMLGLAKPGERDRVLVCNRLLGEASGLPAGTVVHRALDHSIYTPWVGQGPSRLVDLNAAALRDLSATDLIRPNDVIVVHSTNESDILGLAVWLEQLEVPAVRAVVGLMFPPVMSTGRTTAEKYDSHDVVRSVVYERALARLRSNPNVVLGAFGPALAETFAELDGLPMPVLPSPMVGRDATPVGRDPQAVVLHLGDGRIEKGLHLVAETARILAHRLPQTELVVHMADSFAGQHLLLIDEIEELAAQHAPLRVLRGRLDEQEYRALWGRASVVCCFYDQRVYGTKTSGIAWEAMLHGVPAVITPGLWHAREFRANGHPYLEAASCWPEDLASAIERALRSPDIEQRAAQSGERFRRATHDDDVLDALKGRFQQVVTRDRTSRVCDSALRRTAAVDLEEAGL